ncbi:MAG: hypothetical protein AAGI38_10120 [Bacteroidota bacterium]
MKLFRNLLIAGLLVTTLIFQSCDNCDEETQPAVGNQFFTVEYVTPDGTNYINSIYNLSEVTVFADFSGGTNPNIQLERIEGAIENGRFGPFNYTEDFIDPATGEPNFTLLLGNIVKYDYYIKKDTFGLDKWSVEFLLDVDECASFWRSIRYSRNDVPLIEYELNEQAAIRIVE